MLIKERLKITLAELGIVILGVAIALAADSWRENLAEDRIEANYLERLRDDISSARAVLLIERETYKSVLESAAVLTNGLAEDKLSTDNDFLVKHLISATQMGFDRNEMASDVNFQELVLSGNLNLIQNQNTRQSIVAFYRNTERLINGLEELPKVNDSFAALTGTYPIRISQNDVTLTREDRNRLLAWVRQDSGLKKQLRLLHANIRFMDRQFEEAIVQAEELLLLLQ